MAARVTRLDGADLVVRAKPGCRLASLGVFFPGLPDRERAATAGTSWLLVRAALRGADGQDAETLATAAERLGGSIRPGVGAETAGWSITVRPDAVADAAALLRRVACAPRLDPDDVAIERDLLADDAARARDDMFRYPMQQVLAQAFPDDPYGLPSLGTPESVRAIGADDLQEWQTQLAGTRALVVVVGDRDEDALTEALQAFADWPGAGVQQTASPPAWTPRRGTEERRKAQSALAMAFPAPPRTDPARYPLRVMVAVLSGLAGRLFDELRERRALAYTVHAQPWLRRRASALLTYIATAPDREDEARSAMLAELERLAAEPVPDDELSRARNYAAGLVAIRRQHASALMSEIADAWLHGVLDELDAEEARLRAVDAEALSALAARVLSPARRAEYVVRGVAKTPAGTA